jgi:type IV pilus assembly protein PilV
MKHVHDRRRQHGATLIEILVSILILMFGLLGLVGVMIQSQRAQLEAFQREQALLIAQDMVSRMTVNKAVAGCYVQGTYVGVDKTTAPAATTCVGGTATQATRYSQDMADWISLLGGSGETTNSGANKVGGIPFARGCITKDATTGIYQVSVAWQGSQSTSGPPSGVACGKDLYGPDTSRRAVSLTVLL